MTKVLQRKIPMSFSDVEKGWLEKNFLSFLLDIESEGANAASLKVLSTIIKVSSHNKANLAIERTISERITNTAKNLIPEDFTLEEAAAIYELKAATLRRACWSGKLKATKRGKTWFVSRGDLEQYLNQPKKTHG